MYRPEWVRWPSLGGLFQYFWRSNGIAPGGKTHLVVFDNASLIRIRSSTIGRGCCWQPQLVAAPTSTAR